MDRAERSRDMLPAQEAIIASLGAAHVPARLAAALAAPANAACLRCGRTKDSHTRGLLCPPITGAETVQAALSGAPLRAPGGIFEAPPQEADE